MNVENESGDASDGRERKRSAGWRGRLPVPVFALLAALGLAACGAKREPDAAGKLTMKPSITYLHLLQHTPFFTSLSKAQLRWVIDHSQEWEVDSGAVIATCNGVSDPDAPYWILLDGGWQIEYKGQTFRSGHADPGKWFSKTDAGAGACALVANGHGYVMRIERKSMRTMLDQGFAFGTHLDSGLSYYRLIFGEGDLSRATTTSRPL